MYPATPTASVEALQESATEVLVMAENVGVPGVEGAVVSVEGAANVVTLAAVDCTEVFPASSTAETE